MRSKKKGFTLVELLVVIAILAVLASVSVVGYLSFTNKAKESNDISLTKQMNTILQGETATEGANKVAYDAVLDLQENGLDVTKLTPTSEGYEFVWDLTQDKFFLLDKTGKQVAPQGDTLSTNKTDIFKFVGKDGTLSNEYSNYLKNDYVSTGTETISTGFDAGENTTVTTLNYNNTTARTTTIRTNGGTLQVTAPNDTVHHYGHLDNVDVVSVDMSHCYNEYGTVTKGIDLKKGKIVVKNNAVVSSLVISAKTSTDIVVKVEGTPVVNAVVAEKNVLNDSNATLPKEVVKTEVDSTQNLNNLLAIVNQKAYTDILELAKAITTATTDLDVRLLDDIEISQNIVINQSLNLNLNGHKIINKVASGRTFNVLKSNANININGIIEGSEIMTPKTFTSSHGFFDIKGANSVLTVNGGKYYGPTANGAQFKIRESGCKVTLNNLYGHITSNEEGGFAFINSDTIQNINFTVNNSSFECDGKVFGFDVIKTDKNETLATFNNVKARSKRGPIIECCGGYSVFNNCDFVVEDLYNPAWFSTCVATSYSGIAEINGGRYVSAGSALFVYSSGGKVIVNDGFVNGGQHDIELTCDTGSYNNLSQVVINGGKFQHNNYKVSNEFCEFVNNTGIVFEKVTK